MFWIDSENNIILTQGNTAEIDITPLDEDGDPVQLDEGDEVIFKVNSFCGEVIKKRLRAADWDNEEKALKMILNPRDTVLLPPMAYTYDCLYIFADGSAKTFINAAMFKVVRAIAKVGDGDAGA